MTWFYNLRISVKLVTAFVLVAVLAGVVGFVGITNIRKIDNADTRLYEHMTVPLGYMTDIAENFQMMRVNLREAVLARNAQEVQECASKADELSKSLAEYSDGYRKLMVSKAMKAEFGKFNEGLKGYDRIIHQVLSLARAGRNDDAHKAMDAGLVMVQPIQDSIDKMKEMKVADAKQSSDGNTAIANKAVSSMIILICIAACLAVGLGLYMSSVIGSPVRKLGLAVDRLATGDVDVSISSSRKDEIGKLMDSVGKVIQNIRSQSEAAEGIASGDLSIEVTQVSANDMLGQSMRKVIDTLRMLVAEMNRMSDEHNKGDIDVMIPADRFQGGYSAMADGINGMVAGHIAVKKKAMACIAEFAHGNIDAELERFPGKKAFINENIELLRTNLRALMREMNRMSDEHNKGDIDVMIPAERFDGVFGTMADGINGMVAGHIAVKKKAMACIAEFAHGNIDAELERFPGKKAFINENIELLRTNLKDLIREMNRMSDEHNKGDIDVMIPAERFDGVFGTMADGMNGMVAGHIAVKKKAMACIAEFGRGNFEAELEKFPGKKAFINDTIEQVRVNLKSLIADANMLSVAAVEGRLATRADASKHQGDFRKIVQGVNDTLDAVIGPLNVSAQYVDKISKGDIPDKITDNYNGDFNTIKNNLNTCIAAVDDLVADANMLSAAAVEGRLATRADASKHQGDFRKIVQGVNATLDAVIGPLNVSAQYVDRISKGDIPDKITDNYNGDFNTIKNNLNTCIVAVDSLVADADMLVQAALDGRLSTRADASKHQGDFRKIVEGVNRTLDAVIDPVNEAAQVLDRLSDNDLTARVVGDYKGDHAKIKESLNSAMISLEDTIRQTVNASGTVLSSAQQVAAAARGVGQVSESIAETIAQVASGSTEQSRSAMSASVAMEQLSRAIGEVTRGAESQAKTVEDSVLLVQQISSAIQSVTRLAEQVAVTSNDVSKVAKDGGESVGKSVQGMSRIKGTVDSVAGAIFQLGENSKQIGAIVETIDDIAEQTNLLALNAAIEAARAGEHGKGFAVVADEVRKLAERSSRATKEIADLIGKIQEMTHNAVQAMQTSTSEVANGTELANEAGRALGDIVAAVNGVTRQIEEMSAAIQQMSAASGEVARSIEAVSAITEQSTASTEEMSAASAGVSRSVESVAAISEQNAASSEEVAASAEEQNASVEEMAASAEEVARIAEDLQAVVSKFVVDDQRDTASAVTVRGTSGKPLRRAA